MSTTERLPVLPLDDEVVLPGMVVPLDLSDAEVRAAVDAAGIRWSHPRPAVPRLDGRYGGVGTLAVVEQVGRLPGGEPGALVRGTGRARIGTGTTGPGAALWVEVTELPDDGGERAQELAKEYKALVPCCRSAARGRSSTWSSRSTTRRCWPTRRATPPTSPPTRS